MGSTTTSKRRSRRVRSGPSAIASSGGATSLDNPAVWLQEVLVPRNTSSGESVGPETALGLSVYWACLNNISQDLAKIPLQIRRRRETRGSDEATDHGLHVLLRRRPNPLMGPMQFRQTMTHRRLSWGNAYAEIVRDGTGRIAEVWPVHPLRIKPKLSEDGKTLIYEYRPDGRTLVGEPLESRRILHLRGMGSGIEGISVLRVAAEALGLGLAAQRHAAKFYGDGMSKRLVAVAKHVMTAKPREEFRKRLKGDQENDPEGARKLPFLEGDIDLKEVGISPDEAQFLESRTFSVPDIARWFRMALAKIQHEGGAKGWSTLEALNRDYWTDALHPLAVEWEEECWLKLLTEQEQGADTLYFHHVFQALLRADYQQRWAGYVSALDRGVMSRNEVRDLEDMNPIEGPDGKPDPAGDVYTAQAQNVPISVPAEPAASDPDDAGEEAMAAIEPLFMDAARRMVRVEANAARRALQKHGKDRAAFDAWAAEFRAEHRSNVVDAFAPLICAAAKVRRRVVADAGSAAGRGYDSIGPVSASMIESERAAAIAAAMLAC